MGEAHRFWGQGVTSTSDRLSAAHLRLVHDGSFQFDLEGPAPPPAIPDWIRWLGKALSWVAPYTGWLLWAALGLGVIAILFLLVRGLWLGRRKAKTLAPAKGSNLSDWRPDRARARALLSDADRLAEEGRFAEAVRLLLHRSIDEIEDRRPTLVAVAYTSRDIAALERLPAAARAAFAKIVHQVEYAVFGARPTDASAYNECRAAYTEFAFPDAWTGPDAWTRM